MKEKKQIIASIFRRHDKEILPQKDFLFTISMDMHWFSPKDAQKLLYRCLAMGLLRKTNGKLKPNFDLSRVKVPLGFRPSKKALESGDDLFMDIVESVVEHTSSDKKDVIARINRLQEELNLQTEVAALLDARRQGLGISKFLERAEKKLRGPQHS